MKHSRIIVLFLVMVIPFMAYAQRPRRPRVRSQMLEGVVVDTIAGPRWEGVVIESGGKKYSIVLHLNRPEGRDIDPTVVGGNVESPGTRVRVFYTGMGSQSNDPIDLYAIRVVKLSNQTVIPKGGRQSSAAQSGDWNSFWNAFTAAVNRRDRVALRRMMPRNFELHGHGVDGTSAEWIRWIDEHNGWRGLQRSVASGTRPYNYKRRPARVTNDNYAIFELGADGRWRWTGIMGD